MLTVHARFREQKGHNTGLANWEYIKRIKYIFFLNKFLNGNFIINLKIIKYIYVFFLFN